MITPTMKEGQLALELTEVEARQLTDQIKETAEQLWRLLLRAYEGKAWKALGYITWAAYVNAEFDMSRTHSYAILNQGRMILAIENAVLPMGNTEMSYVQDISVREAQDIRPVIDVITTRIREEVMDVPEEEVKEIVAKVVEEERAKAQWQRQVDAEAVELEKQTGHYKTPDEKKAYNERINVVYKLYDALEELEKLPPPPDFAVMVEPHHHDYFEKLDGAIEWLQEMRTISEGWR